MGYNENWHKEVSSVDVVDKKGRDIVGVKEEDIRRQAIDYLNREENRKLPPHEFNSLVFRVKEYLRKVDNDRSIIDKKFGTLKLQVENEARNNIANSKKLKPNELNFKEIKSLAGLSHYIDKSGDESMRILEKEIGIDNIWKIMFLTGMYTSIELGKSLADILKIGEGTAEGMEALNKSELSGLQKLLGFLKGTGIDLIRGLSLIPGLKFLVKGLSKIRVPKSLYNFATETRGSFSARKVIDTRAVNRYLEKTPNEINKILDGEINLINNVDKNLNKILEGININDKRSFELFIARGNKWLEARLKNMTNIVDYTNNYKINSKNVYEVNNLKYLKDKIGNKGLIKMYEDINQLIIKGVFKISDNNQQLLNNLLTM